jgi:hypothetical protein
MLLLFTFVLLGSYVIWTGFTVINGATLLFTAIAVLIRTPVYLLSLIRSGVDMRGRLLIAWFGPRGLSSLLLVLLPVFAGLPGSEQLFAICSLVVLVSVVLHGGAPMLLAQAARKKARREGAGVAGGAVAGTLAHAPAAVQEDARIVLVSPREEQPTAPISRGDSTTSSEDEDAASIDVTAPRRLGAEGDGARVGSQRISLDELRRLWQVKEPVARPCGRTREGTRSQTGGVARRLLRLNERSDQRPCGAGTQTGRMEESARPHRRLDGVAGSRSAGGDQNN